MGDHFKMADQNDQSGDGSGGGASGGTGVSTAKELNQSGDGSGGGASGGTGVSTAKELKKGSSQKHSESSSDSGTRSASMDGQNVKVGTRLKLGGYGSTAIGGIVNCDVIRGPPNIAQSAPKPLEPQRSASSASCEIEEVCITGTGCLFIGQAVDSRLDLSAAKVEKGQEPETESIDGEEAITQTEYDMDLK